MALILSIETSTTVCSVAIHSRGVLKAVAEVDESGVHAEKIMLLIEQACDNAGVKLKDLDAIAVSEGPGSYTGLRIGVSTAKGLSFGLDIPLIGVNTLQALGSAVQIEPGEYLIPVLDARRMEVYFQVFDSDLQAKSSLGSEVLTEDSFQNFLKEGRVIFLGDAVEKVRDVVQKENSEFNTEIKFSAAHLGQLAFQKFQKKEFENLAYFVPNYLKEFKALQSKKNPLLSL
jgi:tRNA threonylcarbamoyladenosine biosynthesis protein TsaB